MKKIIVLAVLSTFLSAAHAGMHSGLDYPTPVKTIDKPAEIAQAVQAITKELAEGNLKLSLISERANTTDIPSAVAAGFKVVAIEIFAERRGQNPQYVAIKYNNYSINAPIYFIASPDSPFYVKN